MERRLDGGGDELRGFRVDDDVPAEQHAAGPPEDEHVDDTDTSPDSKIWENRVSIRLGAVHPVDVHGCDEALRLYREHLLATPELLAAVKTQLAGRDLACWCKLADPCHADVLLSVANPGTDTPGCATPETEPLAGPMSLMPVRSRAPPGINRLSRRQC